MSLLNRREPRMRNALMAVSTLLPMMAAIPAMAQAPADAPQGLVLPQMPRPAVIAEGGFAVSGMDDPSVWQFAMGPRGPSATLHLSRAMDGGSIMFRCSRPTGAMEVALLLQGYAGEVGSDVPVTVTIGTQSHPVPMKVTAPADGETSTALVASGVVVSDLIAAMATNRTPPEFMTLQAGGHKVEFPIGGDRTLHEVSAKICAGWSAAVAGTGGSPARQP